MSKIKGRGTSSTVSGRFASAHTEQIDDGWFLQDEGTPHPATRARPERAKSIISHNRSPDIPFEQSINPYRGCEHGCIYCYARPSHAYMDLSPGLDFETQLFYKPDAARLLEQALCHKNYRCKPIALGTNTDPYQPLERQHRITRSLLEVMQAFNQPFTIVTKSALILRDLDIISEMADRNLCSVAISLTTLDTGLKQIMEPRAASPIARLKTIKALSSAGVPTGVMIAPIIPAINDAELEQILQASSEAGASTAAYVYIRLPHEVRPLFHEWLEEHFPDRAEHVKSLIQQSRSGKDYQAAWHQRQTGVGVFSEMLSQRFKVHCRKHGLQQRAQNQLDTQAFSIARELNHQGAHPADRQASLF